MHKPKITIRLGAAYDEVVVDGHRFDRSKMKREEKSKLRRIVRDCFAELSRRGIWGKQAGPKRNPIPAPGASAYLRPRREMGAAA